MATVSSFGRKPSYTPSRTTASSAGGTGSSSVRAASEEHATTKRRLVTCAWSLGGGSARVPASKSGSDWGCWVVLDPSAHLSRSFDARQAVDEVEGHVDPCGDASRGDDVAVVHEPLVASNQDRRVELGQQIQAPPVRRRASPCTRSSSAGPRSAGDGPSRAALDPAAAGGFLGRLGTRGPRRQERRHRSSRLARPGPWHNAPSPVTPIEMTPRSRPQGKCASNTRAPPTGRSHRAPRRQGTGRSRCA